MGVDFIFPKEQFSYDSGKFKKIGGKKFAPTLIEAISGLGDATKERERKAKYKSEIIESAYDGMMRNLNSSNLISEHFHATTEEDAMKYRLLREGQSMKDLPENLWHASFRRRAFRRVKDGIPTEKRGGAPSGIKRLRANMQSLTITGSAFREFIHPIFDRMLTIRECARIQSFPDYFDFIGNATSVMQQIGNAVPPLAAEILANHLMVIDGMHGSGKKPPKTVPSPRLLGYVLTDAEGMSDALRRTDNLLRSFQQGQLDLA